MAHLLYLNYSIIKIKWGDTSMPASPWGGWGVNGAGRGGGGGPTPASSWSQLWGDKRSSSSSHTHWPKVTDWGGCHQGFQTPVCLTPNPQSFITVLHCFPYSETGPRSSEMHWLPRTCGEGQGSPAHTWGNYQSHNSPKSQSELSDSGLSDPITHFPCFCSCGLLVYFCFYSFQHFCL